MANLNAPRGFIPVRHKSGVSIVQNEYTIASGYSSNIFRGDPVMLTGTANNIQLAVGTAGTPTPDGLGVFAGCTWTDSTGKYHFSPYWPASTVASDAKAVVLDDPQIVFEVQSLSCALNDLGALADFTAAAGSAMTGQSGSYLDSTTGTTAKTFRLERIIDRPDNAVGAYAKVEVTYAEHCRNVSISGVGGM
jgi:hypothetical protein